MLARLLFAKNKVPSVPQGVKRNTEVRVARAERRSDAVPELVRVRVVEELPVTDTGLMLQVRLVMAAQENATLSLKPLSGAAVRTMRTELPFANETAEGAAVTEKSGAPSLTETAPSRP